jgi:hypothetical protein
MKHGSAIRQRPDFFGLDKTHPLARGLVFAGLGRGRQSLTMRDSSGRGNHGTLTNMAVPATATSGWAWDNFLGRWAMRFDGINDYVIGLPNLPTSDLTFSCWVKLNVATPVTPSKTGFAYIGTYSAGEHYPFTDGIVYLGLFTNKRFTVTPLTSVDRASWHTVAITLKYGSPSVWSMYQNGLLAYSTDTVAAIGATGAILGGAKLTASYWLDGRMADATIHTRVLSLAEISALADPSNAMLSGLIVPPRRRFWAIPAAGGTAWSQTINESLGMTDVDARLAAYSRAESDSLGLTDTVARAAEYGRAVAEAMGITDSYERGVVYDRALEDSEGISDAVTRSATFLRSLVESEGLADTITAATFLVRVIVDSMGITDAAMRSAVWARLITDSEALSDAVTRTATSIRALSEALGIADIVLDTDVLSFLAAWYVAARRHR